MGVWAGAARAELPRSPAQLHRRSGGFRLFLILLLLCVFFPFLLVENSRLYVRNNKTARAIRKLGAATKMRCWVDFQELALLVIVPDLFLIEVSIHFLWECGPKLHGLELTRSAA